MMCKRLVTLLCGFALFPVSLYGQSIGAQDIALDPTAGKIYWTDHTSDAVQRANLDGTDIQTLVSTDVISPEGIVIDLDSEKMYWVDWGSDTIRRADLDGSTVEDLVITGLDVPVGIAIDPEEGKLYWVDSGIGMIQRANLDGSGIEDIVTTGLNSPQSMAIDTQGNKIYWTDNGDDVIRRANLDGSQVETLVATGVIGPEGIDIDPSGGKMYWTDNGNDTIRRANLDGSGVEILVSTDVVTPEGIFVDPAAGKMYWTDIGSSTIKRANLDGTDVENVFGPIAPNITSNPRLQATPGIPYTYNVNATGRPTPTYSLQSAPPGMTISTNTGIISWTPADEGRFDVTVVAENSFSTDTQTFTIEVSLVPSGAQSVALDLTNNKLYWTDLDSDAIQRSNLDGTDIEILVSDGVSNPEGIAVDPLGGKVYWTGINPDVIQRANLDGSGLEELVTMNLDVPNSIALAIVGGKMYWSDQGADMIKRANLDGSQVEELITTNLEQVQGIAVDVQAGKIYWTDSIADMIKRANLDGSQVEDIVTTDLDIPEGIAIDPSGGKIYWTDNGNDTIKRANLDGSNVETLVSTEVNTPEGIAVDPIGGKMYWTDAGLDTIKRANLDGSQVEDVFDAMLPEITSSPDVTATPGVLYTYTVSASGSPEPTYSLLVSPPGMTINASTGVISWTPSIEGDFEVTVVASNSVASDTQSFTISVSLIPNEVQDVALDSSTGKIYWTDQDSKSIQRANLDGTGIEVLVSTGVEGPEGIALDLEGGKMYWVDLTTDTVQRANLDGSSAEVIVSTGLSVPVDIVIDSVRDKIYWVDSGIDMIQRSNLDGSNVEDIITTGLSAPQSIALDAQGGKIYWTDSSNDAIQRANLDGSEVEDLVTTGLSFPEGIALDVEGGRMYWTDSGDDTIKHANLDGSGVETLVSTEISIPEGIAVDLEGGKMYWADRGFNTIKKANLDGSDIQDVFGPSAPTIISTPETIAVPGVQYTYDVNALGNPAPTFLLLVSPAGMTINSNTGVISWTPSTTGTFEVSVVASNSVSTATQTFTIQVSASNSLASLAIQPVRIASPTTYILSALINPNGSPTTVIFEYGSVSVVDSAVVATPDPLLGSSEVLVTARVTGLVEDERYQFRAIAINAIGRNEGEVLSFTTYESSYQIGANQAFLNISDSTGYRMKSIPGQINISPVETFGGSPGDDWRLFLDNGQEDSFFELFDGSAEFNFVPGKGFWVIGKEDWIAPNQQVSTVELGEDGTYSISIHEGWNIIGSVFDRPLPWEAVLAANPSVPETSLLWGYQGTFDTVDLMNPYEGYYFLNNDDSQRELKLPFMGLNEANLTSSKAITEKNTALKQLTFHVTTKDSLSTSAYLVLHPDADVGLDRYDQMLPRPEFAQLSFSFDSYDVTSNRLLALDARPEITEGDFYDATLTAIAGEPVQFSVDGLEAFKDWEISLIEIESGSVIDLHNRSMVTLYPKRQVSKYRLLVGSAAFVEAQQDLFLPGSFTLGQSYPNPFSSTLTITYSLPESQNLQVRIYDILGREVALLVEGIQAAGRHEIVWDGSDVPAGVYLVRAMSNPGATEVRKLVKVD